jgi:hypothetical protein
VKLIEAIVKQNESTAKGRLGQLTGTKALNFQKAEKNCGKLERETILEEAKALEEEGLVQVKWYDGKNVIQELRFHNQNLPEFYRRLGWEPSWQRIHRQQEIVRKALENVKKEWIREYCQKELLDRLDQGNIPENLKREGFMKCLLGLDQLTSPIFKRLFSVKYLKDSKAFEKDLQGPVITAARKYCPLVEEGMEDFSVLSQLYIEEYGQQLWVKGGVKLEISEKVLDLSGFPFGIGLNSQMLKNCHTPQGQKIKRVVTVENKSNFESMPYEDGTLYIFTHGFPGPLEKLFLAEAGRVLSAEGCSFYHTGDLDLGGVRIFRYIRTQIFPGLQPLKMDEDTYEQYKTAGYGREVKSEAYLEELGKLNEPLLQGLVRRIIRERWIIEQESFLL